MGRQGQHGAPNALPCGESGEVRQASNHRAAVQVAGEDQYHQCEHLAAQGQHHQHTQSAG